MEKQETTHYASGVHVVVEGGVISYRVRLFFAEIVMNNTFFKGVVCCVVVVVCCCSRQTTKRERNFLTKKNNVYYLYFFYIGFIFMRLVKNYIYI